jgi:ATP-dependent Clp protease ATP-binding subunit ClpX
LKHYGLLPEFCGRFSSVALFYDLSKEDLMEILNGVENSYVSQFKEDFNRIGIELVFTNEAIEFIAERAMKLRLGARGLLTVLQCILLDTMFEAPSRDNIKKCIVNKDSVIKEIPPTLLDRKGKVIKS